MANPKLFISYHPSNPEHQELVLQTAVQLRGFGVDVCLDKWDLAEGADAGQFLEKMVAAPETKVVIVSDKLYAEKADRQTANDPRIISRALYEKQSPDKFALVFTEKEPAGRFFVPAYFKSDVFFDLSQPDCFSDNFNRLLRWIYGKPLYPKPPLGEKPLFIDDPEAVSLGTDAVCKNAMTAVKDRNPAAAGRIDEYLTAFAENFERFRIADPAVQTDQAVYDSIKAFRPFLNEYIRFLTVIAGYRPETNYPGRIHRFFEQLISYTRPTRHSAKNGDSDFDNFMFIVHELFLYTIAVFLKYEMFAAVAYLLSEKYYVAGKAEFGREEMIGCDSFHQHIESLEQLNQRLEIGCEALRAEMIKERCAGTGLDFRHLIQADFTIFLRAEVDSQPYYSQWWPETLMFLGHFRGAFEIYARAKSKAYFEQMKIVPGIENPGDLFKLMNSYDQEMRQLPRGLSPLAPSRLTGFESLATEP